MEPARRYNGLIEFFLFSSRYILIKAKTLTLTDVVSVSNVFRFSKANLEVFAVINIFVQVRKYSWDMRMV